MMSVFVTLLMRHSPKYCSWRTSTGSAVPTIVGTWLSAAWRCCLLPCLPAAPARRNVLCRSIEALERACTFDPPFDAARSSIERGHTRSEFGSNEFECPCCLGSSMADPGAPCDSTRSHASIDWGGMQPRSRCMSSNRESPRTSPLCFFASAGCNGMHDGSDHPAIITAATVEALQLPPPPAATGGSSGGTALVHFGRHSGARQVCHGQKEVVGGRMSLQPALDCC